MPRRPTVESKRMGHKAGFHRSLCALQTLPTLKYVPSNIVELVCVWAAGWGIHKCGNEGTAALVHEIILGAAHKIMGIL